MSDTDAGTIPAGPGEAQPAVAPKASNSIADTVFAAAFWIVVLVLGLIWYYHEPYAQVLLDVGTQPEQVAGSVSFAGRPLDNGSLRISVYDAGSRRYVASSTLTVGKDGRFATAAESNLGIEAGSQPGARRALRVTAEYVGLRPGEKSDKADKPDKPPEAVRGETTLYINASAPLGPQFLWSLAAVALGLLVLQLWVFTGELGRRKARTLFVLMYFFTFWSLALPLVVSLLVAQNKYLVESMENSPLGLIRAKTSALAEPQWLINIGGVRKAKQIVVLTDDARQSPSAGPPTTAAANAADVAASAAPQTTAIAVTKDAATAVDDTPITIEGGVTVPFFMVLLAMFGAGINMTLKVPAIQRAYEDVMVGTDPRGPSSLNLLVAPWRMFSYSHRHGSGAVVPYKTAGDIRRDLIENYMYLLSAPLLAIAVYYLLQVMATQVTQPVLVLMALATGLVSKAVVGGIIDFAEGKLLSARRRGSNDGDEDEPAEDAPKESPPSNKS